VIRGDIELDAAEIAIVCAGARQVPEEETERYFRWVASAIRPIPFINEKEVRRVVREAICRFSGREAA
jgi:hypothetical protein